MELKVDFATDGNVDLVVILDELVHHDNKAELNWYVKDDGLAEDILISQKRSIRFEIFSSNPYYTSSTQSGPGSTYLFIAISNIHYLSLDGWTL